MKCINPKCNNQHNNMSYCSIKCTKEHRDSRSRFASPKKVRKSTPITIEKSATFFSKSHYNIINYTTNYR